MNPYDSTQRPSNAKAILTIALIVPLLIIAIFFPVGGQEPPPAPEASRSISVPGDVSDFGTPIAFEPLYPGD